MRWITRQNHLHAVCWRDGAARIGTGPHHAFKLALFVLEGEVPMFAMREIRNLTHNALATRRFNGASNDTARLGDRDGWRHGGGRSARSGSRRGGSVGRCGTFGWIKQSTARSFGIKGHSRHDRYDTVA